MSTQRLARWSGLVPAARTGRYCARVQSVPIAFRRLQSSVSSQEAVSDESILPSGMVSVDKDSFASQKFYDYLKTLPSPPISAATTSAKLSALHARLQLPKRLPLQSLAKCLVHSSADADHRFSNTAFSILGHDILGYYTAELILCTYPRLPMDVVYAAMKAYVGPDVCGQIAKEWGVEAAGAPGGEVDPGLLQFLPVIPGNADLQKDGILYKDQMRGKTWAGFPENVNRQSISDYLGRDGVPTPIEIAEKPELRSVAEEAARDKSRVTLDNASSTFVRALFGAVYLHAGRDAAKRFFDLHIKPRKLDVSKMFYFRQPTRDLGRLCAREGFERPVGRILSETGRYSRNPVYNLGIFSGREKLGEGSGGSLDEARIRASISALKGWYLYSPVKTRFPSDVEGKPDQAWEPVFIDGGEVIT